MQDSLATHKILALSTESLQKGKVELLQVALKDIRRKIDRIKIKGQ